MNYWDIGRLVAIIIIGIPIAFVAVWLTLFAASKIFNALAGGLGSAFKKIRTVERESAKITTDTLPEDKEKQTGIVK